MILPTGIPSSGRLEFQALRNGSKLGTHNLDFLLDDDSLTVSIAADYLVKLGFLTVFRYKFRCTETWRNGVLMSAVAETDDNGKARHMRARRDGDRLMVDGSKSGKYTAPAGAILATHWNKSQLEAPMVNPQDGDLLRFEIERKGPARVATAGAAVLEAEHFSLRGKDGFDLWYQPDAVWCGLKARGVDGSAIAFQRLR